MRFVTRNLCVGLLSLTLPSAAWANEWNMFRGPNGSGFSPELQLPNEMSLDLVAWKIESGKGGSSLVAQGNKMFYTTYDESNRSLKCIDSATGKELWSQSIPKLRKETATPPNDPAICTAVCDETSVCAFFPDAGILVTSLDGEVRWQKDLGPFYSMHGISASPLLAEGKVIVSIDQLQSPYIAALDLKTGEEIWKTERLIGVTGGYSTPVLMKLDGISLVVSASPGEMVGYDLATGDKRFSCSGVTNAPVGLPLTQGNRIYYSEPPGEAIPMEALGPVDKNKDGVIELEEVKNSVGAYRLIERIDKGFGNGDGKVDQAEWDRGFGSFLNNGGLSCIELTVKDGAVENNIVWKYTKTTPYIPSLMLADKRVYMVNDGGILISFDANTGDVLKRTRLGEATGQYYASPVSDGKRLVLSNLEGKVSLVKIGEDIKPLSTIDLEERVVATPTIHQGRLYVRTESQIYCFASSKKAG